MADLGELPPPLILDQTKAPKAEKILGGDQGHPYLRVWMTAPIPRPPYLNISFMWPACIEGFSWQYARSVEFS